MDDFEIDNIISGIESPRHRKKYKILQIEEETADNFKILAKENNITQTRLLKHLIDSTRELQKIKNQEG